MSDGCDHVMRSGGFCGKLAGHRGDHLSEAALKRVRERKRTGRPNGGSSDTPKYVSAHARARRAKGKASKHACAGGCGNSAQQWSFIGGCADELADDRGRRYCGHPEHYQAMCHRCHKRYDGHVGETAPSAKLTAAQARGIRASAGVSNRELAEHFGISMSAVNHIRTGRSWRRDV